MIAIDLGSNTIRFIEYNGDEWGNSFEKVVRTAELLHETSLIGEKAISRIIDAILEARLHLNFSNQPVVAYATAAMRMASNNEEVIDSIYNLTGIKFKIISGEKEGELTLLAVKHRLQSLQEIPENFILCDIGGGSTEIIISSTQQDHFMSFPVGIVTMSEKSANQDDLYHWLSEFSLSVEKAINNISMDFKSAILVFTAGTPTTVAAYLNGMDYQTYDPVKINGIRLHKRDFVRCYDELMQMDETTRSKYVGVGREMLIATGIKIVETLFDVLQQEESIIIDDGLREGIALEFYI